MKKLHKSIDIMMYWSLVFIPASIAIAPTFNTIFMSILFTSLLLKKLLIRGRFEAVTPIDLPFLALTVVSIISIVNSVDYAVSAKGVLKLVLSALMYLSFIEVIKDKLHVKRIILSTLIGVSFASFDAIWQIVFGKDIIRSHPPILNIGLLRATAAFPDANVLAIYLSPSVALVFGLALHYYKKWKRVLMCVVGVLILIGIYLAFSRAAALAAFISLLLLGIVKKNKLLIGILIVLILLTPVILPTSIKNWAKSIDYNPLVFMLNADRLSMYANTVNMIKHHPIIGVGVNTFSLNYASYKLPETGNAKTGDSIYAHNNFLHMAGEIGLLGLCMFVWLLIRLFKTCFDNYKKCTDEYIKILTLSLIVSLVAFLINGLTETSLYYSRVAIIFWYLVGFVLSIHSRRFSLNIGSNQG